MRTHAIALLGLLLAAPAAAQTAADYNRANQAIQICSSAMGAGIPECAKVRSQFGIGGQPAAAGAPGIGGLLGGGKAQAAAGLLGVLGRAREASAPATTAASGVNPVAVQQAIATCVENARGDNAVIQACLKIASAGQGAPAASAKPGLGIAAFQAAPAAAALAPTFRPAPAAVGSSTIPNANPATAMGIYNAGQSYQACVASNPNWQACLPLLNGGRAP